MEKETNLEHYMHRLKRIVKDNFEYPKQIFGSIQQYIDPEIKHNHEAYTDDILEWMAQPYERPILDSTERGYLNSVIRPFRKEVTVIKKLDTPAGKEYILIILKDDCMSFPSFEKGKMYKGMELEKRYTPEDLGL